MEYGLLIIGFVLLIKGADFFVDGSSSIAKKLRIPALIIGLTIVAFGTSAPEAAVSIIAALNNSNDLAMANVVGSNIFNILVVIGVASMIRPINVDKTIVVKEFPFVLLSYVLLFVLAFDKLIDGAGQENILSRADGYVLAIVFIIYLYSLLMFALNSKSDADDEEIKVMSVPMSLLLTVGGMAGIIIGGRFVVDSAVKIASSFGMSENLIGLTIVAVGTSLPELVTSIVAARKGENDIALGNVVGSNIFNIFFVLGIASIISPIKVGALALGDITMMTVTSLIAYGFTLSKRKLTYVEGAILVFLFVIYTWFILTR